MLVSKPNLSHMAKMFWGDFLASAAVTVTFLKYTPNMFRCLFAPWNLMLVKHVLPAKQLWQSESWCAPHNGFDAFVASEAGCLWSMFCLQSSCDSQNLDVHPKLVSKPDLSLTAKLISMPFWQVKLDACEACFACKAAVTDRILMYSQVGF